MEGRTEKSRIRGVAPVVQAVARELRHDLTPAEAILWEALRDRRLAGWKFRRQQPLGAFVLDFYCAACKLAVELDGGIHDRQQAQDAARTRHLEAYGCRVLRVRNTEVLTDLPGVLARIAAEVLTPSPSPKNRRGEQERTRGPR